MAVQYKRFQGTTPTSTGNVGFSTSFTPTFLILRASLNTSAALAAGLSTCFGMMAGSSQVCFSTRGQDNVTSPSIANGQNVGSLLLVYNASGTLIVQADVTGGLTSTGFTLDFTTVDSSGHEYVIEAFGGDISAAEIIALDSPASTGAHTYSTTLGTPTCAIFASVSQPTSSTGGNSSANGMSLGWAVSSSAQGVSSTWGSASADSGEQLTNACICTGIGGIVGALTSFGSNACNMTFSASGSGTYTFGLFLYGTFNAATFSNNSPTSNGNQSNSLSFSPLFTLVQTLGVVASGSSSNSIFSQSIGTYDGTNSDCFTGIWVFPPKSGDSVAKSVYDSTNAILGYSATPTKLMAASGVSLSSTAEFDFTTTQSTAYQYIGLAIGSSASAPPTPTGLAVVSDAGNPTTVLDVSWNSSSGATSYTLLQSSTVGGTFSSVQTGITGTSTTVTGLTPGTEYAFEVEAVGTGGTSSASSAVAWATEPAAPTGLSAVQYDPTANSIAFTSPTLGANIGLATSSYAWRWEQPVGSGMWTTGTASNEPFLLAGPTAGSFYGLELAAVIESTNGDWAGTIQGPWSSELTCVAPIAAIPARCNVVMARRIDGWNVITF